MLFDDFDHSRKIAVEEGNQNIGLVLFTDVCKGTDVAEKNCNCTGFSNANLIICVCLHNEAVDNLFWNKAAEGAADSFFKEHFLFYDNCLVKNWTGILYTERKEFLFVAGNISFAYDVHSTKVSLLIAGFENRVLVA